VREDRPLNFLHLTTFYPPYSFGGDAMYIYRLAHALGNAGHQVDVVHCIDALRKNDQEPPRRAKYYDLIVDGVSRAQRVVRSLLGLVPASSKSTA
jgi:hypothetical protein